MFGRLLAAFLLYLGCSVNVQCLGFERGGEPLDETGV